MNNFVEYTILTPTLFKQLTTNPIWSSLNVQTKTLPLVTLQNMIVEGERLLNSETAGLFYKTYNPETIANGTYVWQTTPMLGSVSLVQSTLYRCIAKAVAYKYYSGDLFINANINLQGNIQGNVNSSTQNVDVISLRRDFIADLTALGVYESLANTNPTSQLQSYQALAQVPNGITTYGSSNSAYFLNLVMQVSNSIMQGNPTWSGVPNFVNSLQIKSQSLDDYVANMVNPYFTSLAISNDTIIVPTTHSTWIGAQDKTGTFFSILGVSEEQKPFIAYGTINDVTYINLDTLNQTSQIFSSMQTQVATNTSNIENNTMGLSLLQQWRENSLKWIINNGAIMPEVVSINGENAPLSGVEGLTLEFVNGNRIGFGIQNNVPQLAATINGTTSFYPFHVSDNSLWKIVNNILEPISPTISDLRIASTNIISTLDALSTQGTNLQNQISNLPNLLTSNNNFSGTNTFSQTTYFSNGIVINGGVNNQGIIFGNDNPEDVQNTSIMRTGPMQMTFYAFHEIWIETSTISFTILGPDEIDTWLNFTQGPGEECQMNAFDGLEIVVPGNGDTFKFTKGSQSLTFEQIYNVVNNQEQVAVMFGNGGQVETTYGDRMTLTPNMFGDFKTGGTPQFLTISDSYFVLNKPGRYEFFVNYNGNGVTTKIAFGANTNGNPKYMAYSQVNPVMSTQNYYGSVNGSVASTSSQMIEMFSLLEGDATNYVNVYIWAPTPTSIFVSGIIIKFTPY